MLQLYDRYLGVQWEERPTDHSDLEARRQHPRRRAVADPRTPPRAAGRLRPRPAASSQLKRRGAPPAEIARADEVLDPEALTIGFARRFATYKRGTLIFRNLERLAAILNNKDRPVQIIFAGKAHPRDHGGKELIAEILHIARRPEFRRRIVFLEDYDMNVARYLVQGVDVWLNNPRRPLEASGTSGMKVCVNGGLNLRILDGWWVEGYAGDNGWAIGAGEEYTDLTYQDDVESRAIYDLLEQEIVPLFYTRASDGLPRGWLQDDEALDEHASARSSTPTAWCRSTSRSATGRRRSASAMLSADNLKKAARAGAVAAAAGAGLVAGPRRGGRGATAPTRCTSARELEVQGARQPRRPVARTTWRCSSSTASSIRSATSRSRARCR